MSKHVTLESLGLPRRSVEDFCCLVESLSKVEPRSHEKSLARYIAAHTKSYNAEVISGFRKGEQLTENEVGEPIRAAYAEFLFFIKKKASPKMTAAYH